MIATVPDELRIPVSVLVERRPSTTPWAEWTWTAVEVLEDAPPLPPWTVLRRSDERTLYLAGVAEVALYPTDASNYRDNLLSAAPLVWVVLRPGQGPHGLILQRVTVDGGEAESLTDAGADLMDALPLPGFLAAPMAAFVSRHYVERNFYKRRRDGARGGRRRAEDADG